MTTVAAVPSVSTGSKLHFTPSASTGDAFKRWKGGFAGLHLLTVPLTEEMALLVSRVAAAKMAGLFYTKDIDARVLAEFDFTAEELSRETDEVEGGVVGMDIYYAGKIAEAQIAAANEVAAHERLALTVGAKLPKLRFFSGSKVRTLAGVTVESIEPGKIVLKGSAGGNHYKVTMGALAIEHAIDRAKKHAERKAAV